ncbi:MarR family winged helix-turn-helix transcriptional regulator [Clostridium sp. Marseille-P3244]|uniref:MarR family winged helix-turn-helix transcriptional regulator n=1 Tax=Clostridium sp. Marseille-P3244 TaxID=1871020 RepID=UPI0009315C52|nr:MarR family transcriptional regulator [Clostridium sp. Marseille-P3244]
MKQDLENKKEKKEKQLREILLRIELIKRRKVQAFLLSIGLTPGQGQARILAFLSSNSPVTQRELADACMLDVTTMSRTLDKMEKQEVIRRTRDSKSRRSYQISLTRKGEEKAAQVNRAFSRLEEILKRNLDGQEVSTLQSLLGKVEKNLEEMNETDMEISK